MLTIYVIGVVLVMGLNAYNVYVSGGFERAHSVSYLVFVAAFYSVFALLWPLLIPLMILQYFGVLPHPLQF